MKKVFDFKVPKPFDPGIPKENYEAYENEAKKTDDDEPNPTNDDLNAIGSRYEDKPSTEILVFYDQTQKFQPEGPSVVVSLQKSYEYSVSGTHYRVEPERPSYQTSHYAIGQCCVQGSKLYHINAMLYSSIIPDLTEVSRSV